MLPAGLGGDLPQQEGQVVVQAAHGHAAKGAGRRHLHLEPAERAHTSTRPAKRITRTFKGQEKVPTSSLGEAMASRMTLFTSVLSPRLLLLPTSPRHSRARTRADSGDPGLLT